MKRLLKPFFIILTVIVGLLLLALLLLTIFEYRPKEQEPADCSLNSDTALSIQEDIHLLSWNIGYGGLDADVDFFMDGGKMTYPSSQEIVNANMDAISSYISEHPADIYLLQEVDVHSSRTKYLDELAVLHTTTGIDYSYAPNYRCAFVPFPIPPLGRMESGIVTMSTRKREANPTRISLPNPFSWPVRTANLKRCLLMDRFPLEGSDKELVVYNLHLDAYEAGNGRIAQTNALLEIMKSEYEKGNYCIAGGDFNQYFPGAEAVYPDKSTSLWVPGNLKEIPLEDGWQYVSDYAVPSCRLLNQPYDPTDEKTQFYVIDGYITTPNITVEQIKTIDLQFANSDHNPVELVIRCAVEKNT